jgi:hypothetical protein
VHVPIVQPFWVIKHLRTGSVQMSYHILTTQTELWAYIKVINVKIHSIYAT